MCDCIKNIEKEVAEKIKEMDKNIERVTEVSLENTAFMIGEKNCSTQLFSPTKVEYDYKNKKGEIKRKNKKVNVSYQFCPFCGKAYEK